MKGKKILLAKASQPASRPAGLCEPAEYHLCSNFRRRRFAPPYIQQYMHFLPAALRAALNIATGTSIFRRRRFAPPYMQQYMRFLPAALRAALNLATGTSNFRQRRFAPP
jgi:hypothetical protein